MMDQRMAEATREAFGCTLTIKGSGRWAMAAWSRPLDEAALDGGRPLPFSRDDLGRFVREAWVRWAEKQPMPKPSWLVPYDDLPEADKEADRQIGEAVARWTLIGDAARLSLSNPAPAMGFGKEGE